MIRIVIAEEQQMLLSAMGSLLNLEEDIEVVGQTSNGEELVTQVHEMQPDICLMDCDMLGDSGFETAEKLNDLGCKVIMLATFARIGYVQRALQAGVMGYLLKDSPSEVLAGSIRNVMAGIQVYESDLMVEENKEESLEQERFSEMNFEQRNSTIKSVRTYISMIIGKMKFQKFPNEKTNKSA